MRTSGILKLTNSSTGAVDFSTDRRYAPVFGPRFGAMKRALHETITYTKERQAFGRPVLHFQNTQFKLAECKTKATLAEVFVHHCSERLMKGELDAATASMAKYWVSDAQNEVIDECVQLHGGYGYMKEYPIAKMWTDSRVQRIYGGTNEIMKLLIGRTL